MKSSAIEMNVQISFMHNDSISSECVPSRGAAKSCSGFFLVLAIMGNLVIYIKPIIYTNFSSSLFSTVCV